MPIIVSGATKKLSFVYSLDVVSAIISSINAGTGGGDVFGHSFNIAQVKLRT